MVTSSSANLEALKCVEKVVVPNWMFQCCVAKVTVPNWMLQTCLEKVAVPTWTL